jgi:hypothetical protein
VLSRDPSSTDNMSDRIRYPPAMYPGLGASNGAQDSSDRQEQLEDLRQGIPDCIVDDPQRCAILAESSLDKVTTEHY